MCRAADRPLSLPAEVNLPSSAVAFTDVESLGYEKSAGRAEVHGAPSRASESRQATVNQGLQRSSPCSPRSLNQQCGLAFKCRLSPNARPTANSLLLRVLRCPSKGKHNSIGSSIPSPCASIAATGSFASSSTATPEAHLSLVLTAPYFRRVWTHPQPAAPSVDPGSLPLPCLRGQRKGERAAALLQ